jgi:hypothetical protein
LRFVRRVERGVEQHLDCTTASFLRLAGSRKIHKDPAHQSGRHSQKVRPILPVHVLRIHQPQVRLVNEGGGLEAFARAFAAHAPSSDPLQLLMDKGSQSGKRRLVAGSPRE